MKKIMLMVAVIATMLVISCTPKQTSADKVSVDSTSVDSMLLVADSLASDTNVVVLDYPKVK